MENSIIVFDTETTGLPDWKSPSEAEHPLCQALNSWPVGNI